MHVLLCKGANSCSHCRFNSHYFSEVVWTWVSAGILEGDNSFQKIR